MYVDISYMVIRYKFGLGILEALLSIVYAGHGYFRMKILFALASNVGGVCIRLNLRVAVS